MKLPITSNFFGSATVSVASVGVSPTESTFPKWQFEFGEWRKAFAEFQQMEQDKIVAHQAPSALALRQHRYLLFLLLTQGEELALHLMQHAAMTDLEKTRLLNQVDAFMQTLSDSWHTWHGEVLPAHREALARFLA
jgi:hypothetical protein